MFTTLLVFPGSAQMTITRTAESVTVRCPACAVTETYTYQPDASARVTTFPHELGCAVQTRSQAALAARPGREAS